MTKWKVVALVEGAVIVAALVAYPSAKKAIKVSVLRDIRRRIEERQRQRIAHQLEQIARVIEGKSVC